MDAAAMERAAAVAGQAADAARHEILTRFRRVAVETKADGSPVTEADREAELAIRKVLREAYPEVEIQSDSAAGPSITQAGGCANRHRPSFSCTSRHDSCQ